MQEADLSGQIAIVTGAGRGFGRAIAEALVANGARVCLTQRSREQLEELTNTFPAGQVISVPGDVSRAADIERVVTETESRLGPVDLIVSNAGIHGPLGPLWEVDADEWWRTQEVLLRGTLLLIRAVLPVMVQRGQGRLITMASNVGLKASPNFSAYAVAKASQIRLMESVHLEARPHGIAAFALGPGTAVTDLNRSIIESSDAAQWMPNLVTHLERIANESDSETAIRRCAEVCVEIASGRYDALSGRYLDMAWDLDELLRDSGASNAKSPTE